VQIDRQALLVGPPAPTITDRVAAHKVQIELLPYALDGSYWLSLPPGARLNFIVAWQYQRRRAWKLAGP